MTVLHPIARPDERTRIEPGHSLSATKHISFTYHQQTNTPKGWGYKYYLSLPSRRRDFASQTSFEKYPLLLFLHGAGECRQGGIPGSSAATLKHGIPKIILQYDRLKSGHKNLSDEEREVAEFVSQNFITITPSLDSKREEGWRWQKGWDQEVLDCLLDEIIATYADHIDLDRVHVTGLSMGGYGTWKLGIHSPDRFASMVPICGGGDAGAVARIREIPIWVHHGDGDPIISIDRSVEMIQALFDTQVTRLQWTKYPGVGHNCWDFVYVNIEVFRWIYSLSRSSERC